MAVGVGEGGVQVGTGLQLAADDQIIAFAGGVHTLAHGLQSAVGTAATQGGVGHRVERLHGIHAAEVDILYRADIDVGVLSHIVGVATGADALGSLEGVVALVLVVVAAGDR